MPRTLVPFAGTAVVVTITMSLALTAPAVAKPTESATLQCGADTFSVDGFGRGQVLHVVGNNENYIVTRAELSDGTVVFDTPAQADRPIVACTTTTPSGTAYTLAGFFTPAR